MNAKGVDMGGGGVFKRGRGGVEKEIHVHTWSTRDIDLAKYNL